MFTLLYLPLFLLSFVRFLASVAEGFCSGYDGKNPTAKPFTTIADSCFSYERNIKQTIKAGQSEPQT